MGSMQSTQRLMLLVLILVVPLVPSYAWNAYDDYRLDIMAAPWSYVYHVGTAFDGSYVFDSMVPSSMGEPSWMGPNTHFYNVPQCGIWRANNRLAVNCTLSQIGFLGTVPGQGFLCFTAPQDGTYRVQGDVLLNAGDPTASTRAWIRSERLGNLWLVALTEQQTGNYDFTVELRAGQRVYFSQDVIVGVGPYLSAPSYWNPTIELQDQHVVSDVETWNMHRDFCYTAQPHHNWKYVYQPRSSWDGTYSFVDMVPFSRNEYGYEGWKGQNTQEYYLPQCGAFQRYGCLVATSCKLGGSTTTPGQGFVIYTASASGTYQFNGSVRLYSGSASASSSVWIRSEKSGMLWNKIVNEGYNTPSSVSFTIDLVSGQTVVFGQDILVGAGPYQSNPLYWDITVTQTSRHSVAGTEVWDAVKDFTNVGVPDHNWSYVYEPASMWSGSFNLNSMTQSVSYYGWWHVPGAPYLPGEYVAGARCISGKLVLTAYDQSGGGEAVTMLKWTCPRNGYYRIHGSAQLDANNSARLCVVVRDTSTRVLDVWASTTAVNDYDQTLLLDKGDAVLFQIGHIVSGSGSYNKVKSLWDARIEQVAHVPDPWTSVGAVDNAVSCWGRTYDFGPGLLPSSITTGGTNLLSGGMRLDATVGSVAEAFGNVIYRLDERNSEYARMTTVGSSPSLKATCKWRLEYDGMLLCDLTVAPKFGSVNLAKLDLVVPFDQSIAKLFHSFPYVPLSVSPLNCGAITPVNFVTRATNSDGSMTFPDFLHGIWIGDEKRGLQWFAESGEALNPSTSFAVINSSKSLKLNLVEGKLISAENPFKFTFGLQASPVKPALPADEPRWGMWSGATNCWNHDASGILTSPSASWLNYLDGLGMNCMNPWKSAEGAHAWAGDPYKVSTNGIDYQMDELVSAGRGYDMAIMANCGSYIEDIQPGTDWANWGLVPYVDYGYPGLHYICQRSGWSSWFISQARKALRDSLADGFYCDGNGTPWPCRSPYHGCGYVSGAITKNTAAIMDTRAVMKQLYLMSRDTGRRTAIVHHTSGTIMLPCLSFADAYLDGEHLQFSYPEDFPLLNTVTTLGDRNNLQYDLPSYRAEMTGHQFGVPAFVLRGSTTGYATDCRWRSAAYSFIHGRMPVGGISTALGYAADAWRVYTKFGGSSAELVGYWEPSRPVVSNRDAADINSTNGVKITTWKKAGVGALCVVANMRQPATRDASNNPTSSLSVTLAVDRAALGLGNRAIQAVNAVTGASIIKTGETAFTLNITDGQYVWVEVTPVPTIASEMSKPSGSSVRCTGIVTAVFSDSFYIQDPDRSRGIRVVQSSSGRTVGETVTVYGTINMLESGERCINPTVVVLNAGP